MSFAPPSQPGFPPPGQQPNVYQQSGMSPEQKPPDSGSGCGWGTCLLGCLGMLFLMFLACGIGGWYVYNNTGKWIVDAGRGAIVSFVNKSELAQKDKTAVIAQVDRVTDAYKQGKITLDDVGKVMESLAKSPIMQLIMVYGIDEKYIKHSGLTNEEKEAARVTLQRVVRGAFETKLTEQEFDALLDEVSNKQPDGQRQLRPQLSDAELLAFLEQAKSLADEKGIPDQDVAVDSGGKFKTTVEAIKSQLVQPSALSEDERGTGRRSLDRLLRGASEPKIQENEFEPLLSDVTDVQPNGQKQLREVLSDAELRAFLAKARKLADDKGIPDEKFEIDIGAEFKKAVDEALKGKGL